MDDLELMRHMSQFERDVFVREMDRVRKGKVLAFTLAFFLGGLGAHHFYLGRPWVGVVYVIFSATFVPAVIAFFELFFISSRVDRINRGSANRIAARIHASR